MRQLLAILGVLSLTLPLVGCPPPGVQPTGESVGIEANNSSAAGAKPADLGPATTTSGPGDITWFDSVADARSRADVLQRPVLVDFYADWCAPCRMLDKQTWPDPAVAREASRFICARVNVDDNPALAKDFRVVSIPTIVIITGKGRILQRAVGYRDAKAMLSMLKSVR